jgi:hypothetical protein
MYIYIYSDWFLDLLTYLEVHLNLDPPYLITYSYWQAQPSAISACKSMSSSARTRLLQAKLFQYHKL